MLNSGRKWRTIMKVVRTAIAAGKQDPMTAQMASFQSRGKWGCSCSSW